MISLAGGVLIVAEHLEGGIAPSTLELIAAGRRLSESLGNAATIALLGHALDEIAGRLATYGAEVLALDDPALAEYTADGYVPALRGIIESSEPRLILVAHTAQGYDLAPALAGTMNLPLVTNCLALDFDGSRLVATRRLLSEKVQARFEIASDHPIVVTMRPGAMPPASATGDPKALTRTTGSIDASAMRTKFLRLERPESEDIDLSGADIIVSAGRGIQKKENLAQIEEFAKAIGGVVGASRPLTDMDWLPKTRQVGQSGKTVRPKLYVACGISGAMQHVSGMKDAALIVAINTDPSAPIFEVAHIGFVVDVLKMLPATLKEIKA